MSPQFQGRLERRCSTRVPSNKFQVRVSDKSVKQECPRRVSQARLFYKSVKSECFRRVSHKSV